MKDLNFTPIALIDDNPKLRNISGKFLERSGFTILFQAGNGLEALQKIKENDRLPGVCIVEEGFEAAYQLLEKHPELKVLISSINDDEQSVTNMLKIGVSGYILKYADPDELVTAVYTLNRNKKFFSVGVSRIAEAYFRNN